MEFAKEVGKRFVLSAAGTLGVVVVLGLWSAGLEKMLIAKAEPMFSKKTDKKTED